MLLKGALKTTRLRKRVKYCIIVDMGTNSNTTSRCGKRVLFLADFAYASGKAVASGIIRHMALTPGIDLLFHGRTSEMPTTSEWLFPVSNIDGIITCFGLDMPFMRRLLAEIPNCPVVFASVAKCVTDLPGRRTAAILCNHGAIAEAAADLLVRHGLSDFGYVGSRHDLAAKSWDSERREAFRLALSRRGFKTSIFCTADAKDTDSDFAALCDWLQAIPKPCGLFASDDMRAMRVLGACRSVGISVPEQIQVVGADNEEWICGHTSPTLTSVEPDFEGCGHRAAETLLAMMDGREYAGETSFGVLRVEQRMSTTDIHGSTSRAVRARAWLRDNCCGPVDFAQVAALVGCSMRMLQLSYKAVFGRTMQQDMVELRIEHAKRLLSDSDTPICKIPELCGSDSPNHFLQLFKKRTGMTMLQWRRNAS